MTNEEYREFWVRLLGRYPDFKPTQQQTEDWHRELNFFDADLIEATIATLITKYTSTIPKLPWVINTYYNIKNERARDIVGSQEEESIYDESCESILEQRRNHTRQLLDTDISEIRKATIAVIKKHSPIIKMPKDGDIENWSPWLRASVWCHLYG